MTANHGAIHLDDLDEETKERIARLADVHDIAPTGPPSDERKVDTAFLVICDERGKWSASTDLTQDLALTRVSDADDMEVGCAKVVSDINASKIATMTQIMLAQMGAAMQAQMENSRLRSKLKI